MNLLAFVNLIMQRLVFLHQLFVTLGLGTIVGVDDHIIIDGLTPDGGSTTRDVVVAEAVATMVGIGLLGVGLVDVACLVEERSIEVIVGFPLGLVIVGNGKLRRGIACSCQQGKEED